MNFFTTPVMRDGERIEFEDLVRNLEKETIRYKVTSEVANDEMICLKFQIEPTKYETAISWIRTLVFDAIPDQERLGSSLSQILADIPDEKRRGDSMVHSVMEMLQCKQESSARAMETLSKALYLKRTKKLLSANPAVVINRFSELREALHRPENFRILIIADVRKLVNPVSAWKSLTNGFDVKKPLDPVDKQMALLSDIGLNPGKSAVVVRISAIQTSYVLLAAKGPDAYDHPDLPAMMVTRAFLNASEGPLWIGIRGKGMAYSTRILYSIDLGKVILLVSKSADPYNAIMSAKEQVEGYATGRWELNNCALKAAVSMVVLFVANNLSSMASTAKNSFANQVIRGIDRNWQTQMLAKVQAVKPEQVKNAMLKYLLPLFEPKSSNLFVTCGPIMVEKLKDSLTNIGYPVVVRSLESFQDPYGLDAEGDEDDEDEDSDDEDGDDDEGDGSVSDDG